MGKGYMQWQWWREEAKRTWGRNQKRFCLSGPRLLKPVPRPELFHNQPSTYDRVSRRRGPMSAWGITQLSVLKDTFSRDIFISVLVLRLLSLLKY